jgi:hypothetical protein
MDIMANCPRLSKRYIEKAVRPGRPYPGFFMLVSRLNGVFQRPGPMMDKMRIPCPALCKKFRW